MTGSVGEMLGAGGVIATRLPGYESRREQIELAEAVERAFAERRHLLAEAGTGVGKSFAYLLPAIQHAVRHRGSGPVVISTRTIALQQQLEQKDLPFLQQVLPLEWTSVTAVGRNNYVCLRRLHLAHREAGLLFGDPSLAEQLEMVMGWSLSTRDGTKMSLPRPVDAKLWEEVQAEQGNCLHRACPHYDPCPYQRARRRMDSAQVLVVNHALYLADVGLRMAGASYLPAHSVVVFDEAHHLERMAGEHLGLRVTEGTLQWHLRRLHPRNAARSLLLQYGSPRAHGLVHDVTNAGAAWFAELAAQLSNAGEDAVALEHEELSGELPDLLAALGGELIANAAGIRDADRRMELQARAHGLMTLQTVLGHLRAPPDRATMVRWVERGSRGPELHSAPLEVAPVLRQHVFGPERTAVLVSATLGPGGDGGFSWLRQRLGIDDADSLRLGSPFDYRNAVRVVLEEALPDPARDAAAFAREACGRVVEHLLANNGRALVLCTSWSFVRQVAQAARRPLEEAGIPLLVQGDAALAQLLARKREQPTSVLIGTDSLWEGIDVPGDAVTMVIVTKLPFARPDHPLTRARLAAIERRGGNPFADETVPTAILRFRQGFGRLVRTATDRGTVVILDPRVRTKHYGRRFLEALPEGALE